MLQSISVASTDVGAYTQIELLERNIDYVQILSDDIESTFQAITDGIVFWTLEIVDFFYSALKIPLILVTLLAFTLNIGSQQMVIIMLMLGFSFMMIASMILYLPAMTIFWIIMLLFLVPYKFFEGIYPPTTYDCKFLDPTEGQSNCVYTEERVSERDLCFDP